MPSVLSTPKASKRMSDLPGPDRCWLVAGLTLYGLTAKDIADRLSCSIRLVKTIRAEDMYWVCFLKQQEAKTFTDEVRLVRSELTVTTQTLSEMAAECERLRGQLGNVIAARSLPDRVCSGGHEMNRYNTYVQASSGKRFCRQCHRDRQAGYRAKAKDSACTSSMI